MPPALRLARSAVLASGLLLVVTGHAPASAQQSAPAAAPAAAKQPTPRAAGKAKAKPKDQSSAAATAAAGAAAKQDPVEAQRMLAAGQTSLAGGKPDAAIENFNAALAGRGLGPSDMAKALYLRGAAYRKLAKPALAIADLNGALYIRKGLTDADRKDADEQRAAAYREAGLPDQRVTPAITQQTPALASVAASSPPTTAALPAARSAASPAAPASGPDRPGSGTSSGPLGSVGSFIGSLFGSSPPQPAVAEPAVVAPAPNAVSSWSTRTDQRAVVPGPVTRTATPVAAAPSVVQMQLANLRDRVEAEALVERVKQQNAGDLGSRTITIVENVAGSFGRLYAVRVGPFVSADESRGLCTKFRKQGLDCLSVPAP